MLRIITILVFMLPLGCLAQFTITGRVLSQADTKPVANASVFLSNATIGDRTANDGTFTLHNVKPGKYDLVVSIIGFETFNKSIIIGNTDVPIRDITIFPKTITLNEVRIKPKDDANRVKYYLWFKDEFLGISDIAKDCKTLNPDIIDLDYDEKKSTLTASSPDFIDIENNDLGYKIKYLLADFKMNNTDPANKRVFYKGAVLYEYLKGTPGQQKRWAKNREEAYEGSVAHFLKSALINRLDDEGFRVRQLAIYANPNRPADQLIETKIKFYKELKPGDSRRDSVSYWVKKSKLPKTLQKLFRYPLTVDEIVYPTDKPGVFALNCNNDALYVTYNKSHHFHENEPLDYLNDARNKESSLINFLSPYALFYSNGVLANPYSVLYNGKWGRDRVAELLPIDYERPAVASILVDSTIIKNIAAKVKAFEAKHISEKAYLHFDKPYYAAGDTIYFKAYLTQGDNHAPSMLSSVLHIDLVNTANKVDQSLLLQITDGVAWGDIALPDSLPKGNYRVRAYTRWMRNEGNEAFFEQTIPVGSTLQSKTPESSTVHNSPINTKADVQFFPEGGSLVLGLRSKIAFKAIGVNGLGAEVKGVILDNHDKEVSTFASAHLGMGSFYLTPQAGKTYKAKLSYANGTRDSFNLPKTEAHGVILIVSDSLADISVRLKANKYAYLQNRDKNYTVVIYSGGIATNFTCKLDAPEVDLDIEKKNLHTGIARFTLFSPTGEPLSERLVFIKNDDQLNLVVSSDKTIFKKREKISLKLNAKSVATYYSSGHFSVSVIDEGKVTVDENNESTILTNLLLTSDLNGFVEQPNYYFINKNRLASNYLDLVMLTHGYRRFEWKKLLEGGYPPASYEPEAGLEIAGVAQTSGGKPVPNGTIALISPKGGPILTQQTDDKGSFTFTGLTFTDTTHFYLNATNAKGSNNTKLVYNSYLPLAVNNTSLSEQIAIDTNYLANKRQQETDELKYGKARGIMLKEVKIKEQKKDDDYRTLSLAGAGNADQVIHSEDIKGAGSFADRFNGRLIGVSFWGNPAVHPYLFKNRHASLRDTPHFMLVIIDGVYHSGENSFVDANVDDIETIEVLKSFNASIYGVLGSGGVLVITTKLGTGLKAKDIQSKGVLFITAKGFYKAREFYTPKYDHDAGNFNRADLRSTIYWDPELVTDKDGNASFSYFNADGIGNYRVVIEGIDDKGNLGRVKYEYSVE